MLRVGITGGIGSGKSTVCRIFEQLGVPVFHADIVARNLYYTATLRREVIELFGPDAYVNEELNRTFIGAQIFSSPEKRIALNALVHPRVFDAFEEWCVANHATAYTIKEAAIMFETGSYKHLHFVCGVVAETKMRIKRVMQRDAISLAQTEQRMKAQIDQEELISRCDFLIYNNENDSLIQQAQKLHQHFLKLSSTADSLPFRRD